MMPVRIGVLLTALAVVFCLAPSTGWCTRAYGDLVSGEVTAAPSSGEVEIAHHLYHVKAKSAADKALSSIYAGELVDAVLDGPAGSSSSQIISITQHAGSRG
jgi:hypothetical protein